MSSPVSRLGADTPMNTSASTIISARVPCAPRGLVLSAIHRRNWSRLGLSGRTAPCRSQPTMSVKPCWCSSWMIARPAAPTPETTTRVLRRVLADHPQRVGQRGQHHDRGAVLVVVEHRDVQHLPQPGLDLEAPRGRDVLQVDPAVLRRQAPDDLDDQVDVLGVQAHRPGVDPGELLEQRGLALHHRQGGGRADVAQPEHRRPVGDDGDGVALDGQPAGVRPGSWRWPGTPGPRPGCRRGTGRRGA